MPTNMKVKLNVDFTKSDNHNENLQSGENISLSFGKIAKWKDDLHNAAFSGDYNDLENTPSVDTTPTSGSSNLITSGAVYDSLLNKPYAYFDTTANWNTKTSLISELNAFYVYTDYTIIDGQPVPSFKIGDGLAYVVDLPFVTDINKITQTQKDFWNNKVTAYIDDTNNEMLVLSKD